MKALHTEDNGINMKRNDQIGLNDCVGRFFSLCLSIYLNYLQPDWE